MIFFDAHFHLIPSVCRCGKNCIVDFYKEKNFAITCAHDVEEFEMQNSFINENELKKNLVQAFGIHPQMPIAANSVYLETLLKEKKISLIGETGYDLYTEEFRMLEKQQIESFHFCLELAVEFKVPLVIHDRKALDILFKDIKKLSLVPLVIFHSFAFSSKEAFSILRHDVNAAFSFSKQIMNGNKKSISCINELPLECILLETDAPFQTLKNEDFTFPSDIKKVYEFVSALKKIPIDKLCDEMSRNFFNSYQKKSIADD